MVAKKVHLKINPLSVVAWLMYMFELPAMLVIVYKLYTIGDWFNFGVSIALVCFIIYQLTLVNPIFKD
ncbi:hypothetical protein KAR63_08125 [Weissella uvarum]|nr:hypothetical protein [Weissella uvarum]